MSSSGPSSGRARPSAAAPPPGGGQAPVITLETRSPLPRFRVPHFIPSASTSISSFKLSILRILTGQISPSSATSAATKATQPMTHAELVKTQALEGWRAKMILLELRQNSLIAPETRERSERREAARENGEADVISDDDDDDELTGFVLEDEHECALLEEGDEVIIRIKEPHTIQDLELPHLPNSHRYGLPPGSLTRAGTLSAPPPYSLINPSEPSSHSSSIMAQPNANFHAHTYRDYSRGWREIRIDSSGSRDATQAVGAGLPGGFNSGTLQALGAGGSRPGASRTRRASSGQVMTTIAAAGAGAAGAATGRRRPSRNASALAISSAAGVGAASPSGGQSSPGPASPRLPNGATSPAAREGTRSPSHASVESPPAMVSRPSNGAHSRRHSSSAAQRTSGPKNLNLGASSGQASMPSTALIIGPGVQGAVGRSASGSSPGAANGGGGASSPPHSPAQASSAAFAAFTAAGGEIRPVARNTRKKSSMGTASPANGSGGKASMGGVAAAVNANGAPKATRRRASSHDLLSTAAVNSATEEPAAIVAARERVRRDLEEEREKRAKRAAEAAEARRLAAELAETRRIQMASAAVASTPPAVTTAAQENGDATSSAAAQQDKPTSSGIKAGLAALLKPNVGLPPPPARTKSTSSSSSFKLGRKDKEEKQRSVSGATSPPSAAGAAIALNAAASGSQGFAPLATPQIHTPLERDLPPMPSAFDPVRPSGVGTSSAAAREEETAGDDQFAQDMALALALSESEAQMLATTPLREEERHGGGDASGGQATNGLLDSSRAATNGGKPRAVARADSYGFSAAFDAAASHGEDGVRQQHVHLTPGSADILAASPEGRSPGPAAIDSSGAPPSSSPPLSRAEKRYQAVQRTLAKEISKQTEAERLRALEAHNREARRKEEVRRKEEEEKSRKVKEQWEVWEEVRRREKKAGLPPPRIWKEDEERLD